MQGIPATQAQLDALLEHLRAMPNMARACRQIGLTTRCIVQHRKRDAQFNADVEDAIADGIMFWEAEVARRAFDGVDEPLTHQGQFTYERDFDWVDPDTGCPPPPWLAPLKKGDDGRPIIVTQKKYSDGLAQFMLKAHAPDKYRERVAVEHSGNINLADKIAAARKRAG